MVEQPKLAFTWVELAKGWLIVCLEHSSWIWIQLYHSPLRKFYKESAPFEILTTIKVHESLPATPRWSSVCFPLPPPLFSGLCSEMCSHLCLSPLVITTPPLWCSSSLHWSWRYSARRVSTSVGSSSSFSSSSSCCSPSPPLARLNPFSSRPMSQPFLLNSASHPAPAYTLLPGSADGGALWWLHLTFYS